MRKLRFSIFAALMLAMVATVGCDKTTEPAGGAGTENGTDDNEGDNEGDEDNQEPSESGYFDVWASIEDAGGMGSGNTLLIKNQESISDPDAVIDFKGVGIDITSTLQDETLIKDGYYYQIPISEGRFGKYKAVGTTLDIVKEIQLPDDAVLSSRKYCGAWINDDELVIMGSANSYQDIVWVKINTTTMTIVSSGKLDIDTSEAPDYRFSTSGLVQYREEDDKLIYLYSIKPNVNYGVDGAKASYKSQDFNAAFIDPATMAIKSTAKETRAEQTSGTAFGELLQEKTFFTDGGDLYIAGTTSTNLAPGTNKVNTCFVRIKSGETDFDQSYKALGTEDSKIVTFNYLDDNEILIYIQDPIFTNAEVTDGLDLWSTKLYSCYYAIFDLETKTMKELECDGKKLPYSNGVFSTRSVVVDDKVYIGVNSEEYIGVYVYDLETKEVTKGSSIAPGYSYTRIVYHDEKL